MRESNSGPGTPDIRSAGRYLWWLITSQRRRITAGALYGSAWMVCLALPPYLLSRAIDDGLEQRQWPILVGWVGALLGVGVLDAWLSIMRHRTMTRVRMDAAFRSVQVVVRQATRLGGTLQRRVTAGEVVTVGFRDVGVIAQTLTIMGPGVGAVLAYVVVAALLLTVSPLLAAVVLLGVPLLAVAVGPLLGRLQGVESTYRDQQGRLAARFTDIVGGLRVLNGVGGKEVYAERYRRGSRTLRAQGYRVGAVTSWIQALGVGLPALFLGAVVWLAARMAAQGAITVGELVAVYGYTAVLVVPVSSLIESGDDLSRGLVAARRVVRFLAMEPDSLGGDGTSDPPARPAALRDPASGVEVTPGRLTALVSARPAESATVVDRLGRFAESAATWGEIRLDEIDLTQVRRRILVADNEADLFAGPLHEVISAPRDRDDEAIARGLHAAMAQDIVRALPDGLDSPVDAQGRTLSGGQRQRIRLARALLADPEILLAVEPTSAVDAHTEAAVAARLHMARSGRTTVVTSTSPLLLDRADTVRFLVDGRVADSGSHRELLARQPDYRLLVSRGTTDGDGVRAGHGEHGRDGVRDEDLEDRDRAGEGPAPMGREALR
ncbi:ABC transporter ATP-binding protein [Streptomyces sp. YIM 130001]|uniref:ABC transporter ATP-binding protein n=1 Tax=Streptomyces sp. YIM 130001 TaxID=2259644 RepID=UPI000E64AE80|nr:ABC transporter ATP-binding protein [Streptomyces sp. YIM 130001]